MQRDEYYYSQSSHQYLFSQTVYHIYSAVLGKLLTEVTGTGTKKRTFVYGMDGVVALQTQTGTTQEVRWEHTDPGKATYLQTGYNGLVHSNSQAELDPLGSNVGLQAPQTEQMIGGGGWGYGTWGDAFGSYGCRVDGFDAPRSLCAQHLANGSGVPNNNHIQPMFLGHWMPDNREGRKDYFVPFPFFNFVDFGDYLQIHFNSVDAARDALEDFLKNGDCKQALESLLKNLKQLNKNAGFTNEVRSTDILSIFDEINSQEKGGLRLNSSMEASHAEFELLFPGIGKIAGGGGETLVVAKGKIWGTGAYAYVHVFPTTVSLRSPTSNTRKASNKIIDERKMREAYNLIHRLVHELTHAAGENGSFSHGEMDAAAKAADSTVSDYGGFIKKHCIPKKYW